MSTTKKAPPVAKVSIGTVQGAVWQRATAKGNFYSATITNRYKDENNVWHDTDSYDHTSLLFLAKVANQLFDDMTGLRDQDRAAAKGSGQRDPGEEG